MPGNGDREAAILTHGAFLTVGQIERVHKDLPAERVELHGLSDVGQPVSVAFAWPVALDFALTVLATVRRAS